MRFGGRLSVHWGRAQRDRLAAAGAATSPGCKCGRAHCCSQAINQLSKKRGVQMARRSLGHRDGTMVATAAGILGGHGELEDVGRLISFEVRKRARNAGFRAAARIIQRADEGASQDAAMARMTTVLIGLLMIWMFGRVRRL